MSHAHLKAGTKSKSANHGHLHSEAGHYRKPSTHTGQGAIYSAGPVLGISRKEISVGKSGDKYEKEADAASEKISSGQPAGMISRMGNEEVRSQEIKKPEETSKPVQKQEIKKPEETSKPVQKQEIKKPEETPKPVQKQEIKKPEETSKPVQKQGIKKPEETPKPVQKQEIKKPEETPKPIQKQEESEEPVQTSKKGGGSGISMSHAASHAISNKGSGKSLSSSTKNALESGFGTGFGNVRVHDDSKAHEAADALSARAFTHGSDIWLGKGESQNDMKLMAHEAAHVVQQTGGVRKQVAQQAKAIAGKTKSPKEAKEDLETFPLPPVKRRHKTVYESWAAAGNLKRVKGYDRGEPDQKDSEWIPGIKDNIPGLERLHLDQTFKGTKVIEVPKGRLITGTRTELLNQIKVPDWDRKKKLYTSSLEVDHIVELQVGNWAGGKSGPANTIENMELLDKRSNASSGASTKSGIRQKVREYLKDIGKPSEKKNIDDYLLDNDIKFQKVEYGTKGVNESASQYWTKLEIESGKQLEDAQPVRNPGQAGSAKSFALLSPGGGMVLAEYPHPIDVLKIPITSEVEQRRVAGLKLTNIQLNENYAAAKTGAPIGIVRAEFTLPESVKAPPGENSFPLVKSEAGQYSGEIGSLPQELVAKFEKMSDIRFDKINFQGGTLTATGRLKPSIPLFEKVPIDVRLRGGNLEFVYYYRPEDLSSPIPGLTIDDASLGVFFGTEGFGVEGSVDLSIRNLGNGGLAARVDSSKNFEAIGKFNFDSKLFDRAEINIWYRNRAFGGSGTLAIDNPNKVRGIQSATITASFSEGRFDARGTVKPSIPGVREASLNILYSEEEGLTIGGSLQLADNIPGISSGSIDAKVQKRPGEDRWIVKASGEATPKIPGVNSKISVTYDDGAFDLIGTAAYEKGMLNGSVTVGATNRPLGDDGRPVGLPSSHSQKILMYGGGAVTVKIAPWLQGTVGIKLMQNGEIEVAGTIALPDTLDIFPEKKLDKNIFKINLDIPIVGIAVLGQRIGIFATIGGGLDLSAGIGPGQLRDTAISITYNPAHEENTRVRGGAKLFIPAHAGLRLFVRGALGAGIPIVSASAGLEVGGALGIEGAITAGVQMDWTPAKGLVLDAFGKIEAEPKFKFDITGFVMVEANLLLKTVELYSKRWQLAGFEYGSGLRFGVKFPIHYEEGKPFDISMKDVQFEIPQIDKEQLLRDLIKRIA